MLSLSSCTLDNQQIHPAPGTAAQNQAAGIQARNGQPELTAELLSQNADFHVATNHYNDPSYVTHHLPLALDEFSTEGLTEGQLEVILKDAVVLGVESGEISEVPPSCEGTCYYAYGICMAVTGSHYVCEGVLSECLSICNGGGGSGLPPIRNL